jgi:hypothetical protein
MVNRVDEIVRVLSDEGQSSVEVGHPEDRGVVPDGVCWRCVARTVESGHDLCHACRAFLLGDTELDPLGAPSPGDAPVHTDEEIFLGQSSYVIDLFDNTAHELVPYQHQGEVAVELHGGMSDGTAMRVATARDGTPPPELFTPVGMDHGVMRTERYLLDDASGPDVWSYDIASPPPATDRPAVT